LGTMLTFQRGRILTGKERTEAGAGPAPPRPTPKAGTAEQVVCHRLRGRVRDLGANCRRGCDEQIRRLSAPAPVAGGADRGGAQVRRRPGRPPRLPVESAAMSIRNADRSPYRRRDARKRGGCDTGPSRLEGLIRPAGHPRGTSALHVSSTGRRAPAAGVDRDRCGIAANTSAIRGTA
jgi:hypothetical protein